MIQDTTYFLLKSMPFPFTFFSTKIKLSVSMQVFKLSIYLQQEGQ
jgi:hypothetical protein